MKKCSSIAMVALISTWSSSYSRIASGAATRNSNRIFGVVTAGNEMKGSDSFPVSPWQATRQ